MHINDVVSLALTSLTAVFFFIPKNCISQFTVYLILTEKKKQIAVQVDEIMIDYTVHIIFVLALFNLTTAPKTHVSFFTYSHYVIDR
jgi:hypothetical protein